MGMGNPAEMEGICMVFVGIEKMVWDPHEDGEKS